MTLNDSNYPDDFNWKFYTSYYQDLSHLNKIQAINHYKIRGIYENRIYKSKERSLQDIDYINLIGIVNENCSISDNLNAVRRYFELKY